MSKDDLDQFKIDISEEEIAEALSDEEWEAAIADAAFVGAIYLSKITNRAPDTIINEIVTYNVNKKLRQLFIEKSKPLPKSFVWDEYTTLPNAFYLLENFIAQVTMIKEAEWFNKPIKLQITINNNIELQDKITIWCKRFEKKYTLIKMSVKNKNNLYTITFK